MADLLVLTPVPDGEDVWGSHARIAEYDATTSTSYQRQASYRLRACVMTGIDPYYRCLQESRAFCLDGGLDLYCASDEPEGVDPGRWLSPLTTNSPASGVR